MDCKYSKLFEPLYLGNVLVKNRIFAAPASQPDVTPSGYLHKNNICYYEARAKGGAAVVNLGDTVVHTRTGRAHPHKPLMDDPAVVPSLSDAARAIKQHGALACLELSHCGKYANVDNLVAKSSSSEKAYGPIDEVNANGAHIYEMPKDIILEIVKAFGDAAATAKMCGFDMVMIHGGHGWLLHQFMSPSNTRTDEFGGNFENRMRFTHLVLDEVRSRVGRGYPIEFRMSGAEKVPGGYDVDYGIQIAKSVESKVDLIHVSAGIHDVPDAFVVTHPDMFHPGLNVHLAAEIKKNVSVPVATIGGLSHPEEMEEIIASGKADIIEVSRALMADPDLPKKIHMGREDEIVHCMRCFACMTNIPTTKNMRCTLNPRIGRELELYNMPEKAEKSKKVLIVGAGPGGMEAAVTAAKRGHKVILCEASDRMGGELNCERPVDFKKNFVEFGEYLEREIGKLSDSIEVRLNTRVDAEMAKGIAPDAIIIAAGATPIIPPIPGLKEDPRTITVNELRKENPEIGHKVVMIGGGLVGVETAIHLAQQGKEVEIIEMGSNFAPDAPIFHRTACRRMLEELNIPLHLNMAASRVTEDGVVAKSTVKDEEMTFSADTIFCAAGLRPNHEVVKELINCAPETYPIGDCVRSGQAFWTITGGYYAALDL